MRVYPADQRAKATGWWSMVGSGSLVIGLVIGGPLAQALGWRALFVVQAAITAASLLLALRFLPRDHKTQQARVDYLGAGLLMAGIFAVLFAINQAAFQWGASTARHGLRGRPGSPRAIRLA